MIKRFYVEKKPGFNTKAKALAAVFRNILNLSELEDLRIVYRYDVEALSDDVMTQVVNVIFSEPNVDDVYENSLPIDSDEQVFAIEYLPGQYDQHGDFAAQCTQIIAGYKPLLKVAQCVVLRGDLGEDDINRIKEYMINPVDSMETSLDARESLTDAVK